MFLRFPNTLFSLLAAGAAVVHSGVVVHAAKNDGLRHRHLQPPTNDDVCSADPIQYCTATPWDNTAATAEPGEVAGSNWEESGGGSAQSSLWYSFTALSDCVSIYTDNTVDMQAALYQTTNCSDFSAFTEIASDDDNGLPPGIFGGPWIQDAPVVSGQEYLIQLDGYFSATGTGNLLLTECGLELTINLGGCQTRIVNDDDDDNDFNYVRPELPECFSSPFDYNDIVTNDLCTWTDENTGTIEEDRGCDGIKVQPNTTTTYCFLLEDEFLGDCVTVEVQEPCGVGIVPPADLEGAPENFEAFPELFEADIETLEAVTEGAVDDCIVCSAVGEPFD